MTLIELLDAAQAQAPEGRLERPNEGPMALCALQRLGADDARLQAFAAQHPVRAWRADRPQAWPAGDAWPARRGERGAYMAYRDLFLAWRAEEGAGPLLEQVLPQLMSGCAAAGFAGMIRTAAAVQSHHAGELASGLAYWACRWLPLDPGRPMGAAGTEADPEVLLRRLRARRSTATLPAQRLKDAAQRNPALDRAVAALAVDGHTLERLSRLAARACAHSGDPTAVRLLISAHALRVLSPYLDDRIAAFSAYWRAFATTVVAAGWKARPAPAPASWETLTEAARSGDDGWTAMGVDSCRQEEQAWGGDDWRRAATQILAR